MFSEIEGRNIFLNKKNKLKGTTNEMHRLSLEGGLVDKKPSFDNIFFLNFWENPFGPR